MFILTYIFRLRASFLNIQQSPFKTSLALQLKLLRLNSCLWGEAEEVVKILWYTETAYDAAKVRLQREYGRDKRNIQVT